MAIKPWYNIATPREDLREGKPLDASEFAVHLDYVRDGRAQVDYQNPERFFERTFLTKNLTLLAAEVLRRLSGETTETSAVFNMSTQFGGGKTHALTLLYHLAQNGPKANGFVGVNDLLKTARVSKVPQAETAIFVGTEFDALKGRGGDDGSPLRKTPWGEIAYQLGGNQGFAAVEEHDKKGIAPAGDVIRKFILQDKACLILMDEVMNFVSRNRHSGLTTQFYDFLQSLSETARGQRNVVLVVSIPASELEMSAEDQTDFSRFKKLLDRLGKPVAISAEHETSEIIRRRLFEWDLRNLTEDGRVLLSKEAVTTCNEYADWVGEHRQQIPNWFPIDDAKNVFAATYPFHPLVLSVFERKWQTLPRFQQTRGILRLLALWVSHAFQAGFKGAQRDGLIGVGTAPLHDSLFRRAVFEQLGEDKLEAAITTDIAGKSDSFALRLDQEAIENIKKARLHQKIATAIFFESSGGQQQKEATLPEIRLAVGEPGLDVGNIETVLEELTTHCYYLRVEKNRYKFSLTPNLNKLLSDRRASIQQKQIDERVREEVQLVFRAKQEIDHIFFPERSNQIPDKPALRLVVLAPDKSINESETLPFIEQVTRECGSSGRTYKSGLIWAVPDSSASLNETARKLLAWEDIKTHDRKQLDESQQRQLAENLKRAQRDLNEA
ncbi:MAG: ATP-binding protein, partial [bacterium]